MGIEMSEGGGPTTLAKRALRASSSGQSPSITPTRWTSRRARPRSPARFPGPALPYRGALLDFAGPFDSGLLVRGGCLRHRGRPDGRLRQASQPFPGEVALVARDAVHPGGRFELPGWPGRLVPEDRGEAGAQVGIVDVDRPLRHAGRLA